MRSATRSLSGRLFAAQVLVVVTGGFTLGLVAAGVGPPIFRQHLRLAAGPVSAEASRHVEQAYASANAVSLGVALVAALVAALAASAYVARRVTRPVAALALAAADIAHGHYSVRVPATGLGTEFETLAASFNSMAARLETVETTRRRLLADLGHEMRTPLATIEAVLEATEDGVIVDEQEMLSALRTQTSRLRRLTDDIAAVSRAEEHQLDLQPTLVAPGDLVRAAVTAAGAPYASKGVMLRDEIDDHLPPVNADPERMGQVLANLLDNALRHTAAGGRVTVHARRSSAGVELIVTDTGEGIAPAHLPHVFERFYRAQAARDRQSGGSGIGLAIVRAVVSEHGGRVEAASSGAAGATFTVTLPPAGQPSATARRPALR